MRSCRRYWLYHYINWPLELEQLKEKNRCLQNNNNIGTLQQSFRSNDEVKFHQKNFSLSFRKIFGCAISFGLGKVKNKETKIWEWRRIQVWNHQENKQSNFIVRLAIHILPNNSKSANNFLSDCFQLKKI